MSGSAEIDRLKRDYLASVALPSRHAGRALRVWPDEARRDGVLERAMILCASLLRLADGRGEYVIVNVSQHMLAVDGGVRWLGVHVAVIGLSDESQIDVHAAVQSIKRLGLGTIILCVLPTSLMDEWQDISDELRAYGHQIVPIYPVDVTALADGSWTINDMVDFKLYRSLMLEKLDVESQFDAGIVEEFLEAATRAETSSWRDLTQVLADLHDDSNWVEHPRLETVVQSLRATRDCLIVGASSSGKSTLAFQAGRRLQMAGHTVLYIDIGGMPGGYAARAFTRLLSILALMGPKLLILDDLQSGPSVARYVLHVLHWLRKSGEAPSIAVLALTWPSYQTEAAQELEDVAIAHVGGNLVRPLLLARRPELNSTEQTDALVALAGDDLLMCRLILDDYSRSPSTLNRSDLAEQVWRSRTQSYTGEVATAKRAVFVASILGRYEFELPEGYLVYESGATGEEIAALCSARLLRRNGSKIVAGHRSLCTLLAEWLARDSEVAEQFRRRHPSMQPADLVLAYIRALDGPDIWPVLRSLYVQVGFRGQGGTTERAGVLTDFWKALDALIERIEHQSAIDPTWGNILSSALFAVEALCGVGKRERARRSIEFMRSHWRLEGDRFYVLGGTVDRLDFDKISERMWKEDADLGLDNVPGAQSAGDVDKDRFHQTWVSGLVLCAESAFQERSRAQLQELAMAVEGLQSVSGYFYPRRVSWCTARVLMGLARCGRTYYNSEAVRRTCEWLLTSHIDGGPRDAEGVWPSGTDGWNTTLEVTAMCTTALVMAGISLDDPRLVPAIEYISEHRSEWIADGRWLDGAMEVEAFLSLGGNWREITDEVLRLFKEARREAFWGGATLTAKESLKQSCDVASVADYLVSVVWSSLRVELPHFLDAFAVPDLPFPQPESMREDEVLGAQLSVHLSLATSTHLTTTVENADAKRASSDSAHVSWLRRLWKQFWEG